MKTKLRDLLLVGLFSLLIFSQSCSDNTNSSSNSSQSTTPSDTNNWTLGTWSTSPYDDLEFKLTVLPGNEASFYMIESWFNCTYKITGNSLVTTRNDVDMVFNLDKANNKIYMAGGNELSKYRK